MKETIKKFLSKDKLIRATTVINTSLIEDVRIMQNLTPIPSVALGRTITGALLLASNLKKGHRIGINISGDGPIKSVFAEASFDGTTRGCTSNPTIEFPTEFGVNFIGAAIGKGTLSVTHYQDDLSGRYQGTVELQTSEVGEDLAYFLYKSQQIPSIISLGVYCSKKGNISASGGILIELLPGATEEIIPILETNAKKIESISEYIREGATGNDLIQMYLKDLDPYELPFNQPISYRCHCSKERFVRSLKALSKDDYDHLIDGNKTIEITCEFCGKKYNIEM